jgi:cation diffusion facilitator family transporter
MEPDLSASITHHPRPFTLHHDDSSHHSRSSTPRLAPQTSGNGTSTGVEAINEEAEQPVARLVSSMGTDVESGVARRYSDSDPYNLQSAFKTDAELEDIKANTSRKRATDSSPSAKNSSLRGRIPGHNKYHAHKVQNFYKTQNETIERLLKSVEEHRAEAAQTQGDDQLRFRIAVYGSFVANILLAILQLYGAISSGSLSLFTTMADAVFDPMSNAVLLISHRAVQHVDPNRVPSGKARLETTGNIFFCFMMTAVSLILIAFSAQDLAKTDHSDLNTFHLPSVIAVAVAFTTKLGLFLYCWGIKDKYSQVDILWQDHRNDLLINGFGILTSVGGSKLAWWLDPMGSILLSVLISCIWLRSAFAEFMLLVGVVASVEVQQLITYVCVTHSPAIQGIDTVRVYHSGPRLIAEVDIVMDSTASLRETHDVAEELQMKLEDLPDIERAYVHVDYETTHKPEHAVKKEI